MAGHISRMKEMAGHILHSNHTVAVHSGRELLPTAEEYNLEKNGIE